MFLKFLSNHLISVVTVTICLRRSKEPQCQAEIHTLSRHLGLAFWLNALFSLPTNLKETFIQISTLLKLQILISSIFRLSVKIKPWLLKPREHGCFYCSVHLPLWTLCLQASFPNSICILGREPCLISPGNPSARKCLTWWICFGNWWMSKVKVDLHSSRKETIKAQGSRG